MSYTIIKSSLEAALATYAAGVPIRVAWENRKFVPTDGESYLRASLLPAPTGPQGLADTDDQDYQGIFQVDVSVPKLSQMSEAQALIDGVLGAFSRNTNLGHGVRVVISSATGAVGSNEAYHTVPVSVQYRALIT